VVVSGVELFSLSLLRLFSRLADGGNKLFLSLVFSPGSAKNKQKANASLLRCFALLFPSSSARSSLSLRQRNGQEERGREREEGDTFAKSSFASRSPGPAFSVFRRPRRSRPSRLLLSPPPQGLSPGAARAECAAIATAQKRQEMRRRDIFGGELRG